jgi:tetratricopeptide (TPR) repeat protein
LPLPALLFEVTAQAHFQLENLKEAEKYAQKAVAIDPNSWRAHYILANVYTDMNQSGKQIEHYEKTLKVLDETIRTASDPSDLQSARKQIQNELEQVKK